VEPTTGLVVNAAQKGQLNVQLGQAELFKYFNAPPANWSSIRSTVLPDVLFSHEAGATQGQVNQLKEGLANIMLATSLATATLYVGYIAGALLAMAGIAVSYWALKVPPPKNYGIVSKPYTQNLGRSVNSQPAQAQSYPPLLPAQPPVAGSVGKSYSTVLSTSA